MSLRNTFEQRFKGSIWLRPGIYFSLGDVKLIIHIRYRIYLRKLLRSGRHYLSFVPLYSLNTVKRREIICLCVTLILTSCKNSNSGIIFWGRQNVFQDCGGVSCEETFTVEKNYFPQALILYFCWLCIICYVLWFFFFSPPILPPPPFISACLPVLCLFLFQFGVSYVAFLGHFTWVEEKGLLCSFSHSVLHRKEIEEWTVSWGEGVASFPNSVIVILVSKLPRTDSYNMHTLYRGVHMV